LREKIKIPFGGKYVNHFKFIDIDFYYYSNQSVNLNFGVLNYVLTLLLASVAFEINK
jgi:hypothetical protein